jgi:hypothetical protein
MRYDGSGMDADVTQAERDLVWQRLEAVLPAALSVRHDTPRCRVLEGAGNPLRNVLIRKPLAGHTTKPCWGGSARSGFGCFATGKGPRRPATLAEEQDPHRTSRS